MSNYVDSGLISLIDTSSLPIDNEPILHNVIIWLDGIIRPWRGHNQCTGIWKYDGQVFVHACDRGKHL